MNVYTFTNDHLKKMLNAIHHENKGTLLTGDFNVNLLRVSRQTHYNDYFEENVSNYRAIYGLV